VSDLEESVIRRTIYVSNLPEAIAESDIISEFQIFGEIQYIRVDKVHHKTENMALIQFSAEESARHAILRTQMRIQGQSARIMPSSITIEVIPPTDAVFGKPMTVGRHVMSVNPSSRDHRVTSEKRRRTMDKVRKAAVEVLENICARTGWRVPADSLDALKKGSDDRGSQSRGHSSRRSSRRSSYSRSRSRGRYRRSQD
jgi:RNA recognition motif-containing protein